MDYQNRIGSKKGGGGVASEAQQNVQRKQRVAKLLGTEFDFESDPYFKKNHLGQIECRLCATIHLSTESYVSHTKGKKHLNNIQRKAAIEAKNNGEVSTGATSSHGKKAYTKIGVPAYRVVKIRDVETMEVGLLVTVKLPLLKAGEPPLHRFMSAYEQQVDQGDGKENWQYLVVHGEPYQNIALKVEAKEISREWGYWDEDLKEYYVQFFFKSTEQVE